MKQNIDYTSQALQFVNDELGSEFTEKFPLHEYYKYQRISFLGENTMHKLIIGNIETTMIR